MTKHNDQNTTTVEARLSLEELAHFESKTERQNLAVKSGVRAGTGGDSARFRYRYGG